VVGGAVVTNQAQTYKRLAFLQNAVGAVPGPMDCFLVLRGIKTLPVRMDRHAANAAAVADFLAGHPKVGQGLYPYHPSHPRSSSLSGKCATARGMVFFVAQGSAAAAVRVAEGTRLFALDESLGGVESLIEVPSAMTHGPTWSRPWPGFEGPRPSVEGRAQA